MAPDLAGAHELREEPIVATLVTHSTGNNGRMHTNRSSKRKDVDGDRRLTGWMALPNLSWYESILRPSVSLDFLIIIISVIPFSQAQIIDEKLITITNHVPADMS